MSEPKAVGPRKRAPQDISVSTSGFPHPHERRRWCLCLARCADSVCWNFTNRCTNDGVSVVHGIVEVRPHTPFSVKVANFGEETVVLVPNQIVGRPSRTPYPRRYYP